MFFISPTILISNRCCCGSKADWLLSSWQLSTTLLRRSFPSLFLSLLPSYAPVVFTRELYNWFRSSRLPLHISQEESVQLIPWKKYRHQPSLHQPPSRNKGAEARGTTRHGSRYTLMKTGGCLRKGLQVYGYVQSWVSSVCVFVHLCVLFQVLHKSLYAQHNLLISLFVCALVLLESMFLWNNCSVGAWI